MSIEPSIPWHQRIRAVAWLRSHLRRRFFALMSQTFETDDGRSILGSALNGYPRPTLPDQYPAEPCSIYPDLASFRRNTLIDAKRPVFITARFRSGSTLLWNIFRHVDGCTAYYEPFNERRWFDPAMRGSRVDVTHRGVTDYWREYDGLDELRDYYRESWVDRHLYMDAGAWNPEMKQYVQMLIERARERPVLQFNHIDFRLPWFRANFPTATIVHLYRHPRDQWRSTLVDTSRIPANGRLDEFGSSDSFYLRRWARDLKHQFPFLDEDRVSHPYQLFYLIWRLSHLFGVAYAHHSLSFEHLVSDPASTLGTLFERLGISGYDMTRLLRCVSEGPRSRWTEYADELWFSHHEDECECLLRDFFLSVPIHREGC